MIDFLDGTFDMGFMGWWCSLAKKKMLLAFRGIVWKLLRFPLCKGDTWPITIDHGLFWICSSACWDLLIPMALGVWGDFFLSWQWPGQWCPYWVMIWAQLTASLLGSLELNLWRAISSATYTLRSMRHGLGDLGVKLWREGMCPWNKDIFFIAMKRQWPHILGVSA